jgi:hypothetical protein
MSHSHDEIIFPTQHICNKITTKPFDWSRPAIAMESQGVGAKAGRNARSPEDSLTIPSRRVHNAERASSAARAAKTPFVYQVLAKSTIRCGWLRRNRPQRPTPKAAVNDLPSSALCAIIVAEIKTAIEDVFTSR